MYIHHHMPNFDGWYITMNVLWDLDPSYYLQLCLKSWPQPRFQVMDCGLVAMKPRTLFGSPKQLPTAVDLDFTMKTWDRTSMKPTTIVTMGIWSSKWKHEQFGLNHRKFGLNPRTCGISPWTLEVSKALRDHLWNPRFTGRASTGSQEAVAAAFNAAVRLGSPVKLRDLHFFGLNHLINH